jgi:hypothetical protein
MSHIEVLGANIPRASEGIVQKLIDMDLIYIGEDGQLHIKEHRKSTTTPADQS